MQAPEHSRRQIVERNTDADKRTHTGAERNTHAIDLLVLAPLHKVMRFPQGFSRCILPSCWHILTLVLCAVFLVLSFDSQSLQFFGNTCLILFK